MNSHVFIFEIENYEFMTDVKLVFFLQMLYKPAKRKANFDVAPIQKQETAFFYCMMISHILCAATLYIINSMAYLHVRGVRRPTNMCAVFDGRSLAP